MNIRVPVYLVGTDGKLVRMVPSAPATEDELQALIATHPDLIGDRDGSLLLIEREHGVADSQDGSPRWSLDHLYVTQSGIPVLVEVKRAVDTRLRREVVGQLLDYAANGVAYWATGEVAKHFEVTCQERAVNAAEKIAQFLGPERDPQEFWAQVDSNFRSGRVKLVIVADEIPAELARIVEFLNDQMTADVRAVELSYFKSPDGVLTLVPRVIGETERSRAQKSGASASSERLNMEEWLAKYIVPHGPNVVEGANVFRDFMTGQKADIDVASSQGSIYFRLQNSNGRKVYPFFLLRNGSIQIAFGYVVSAPALAAEDARRRYYERFADAIGPLSMPFKENGFPSFRVDRINDPSKWAAFRKVAEDFSADCRGEGTANE